MAVVAFDGVRKQFPDGTVAVDGLDLDVGDGEFIALVGPSGSGKSTVLRMLAGLEDVSDGSIRINDLEVNDLAPRNRDIAMVFQDYALYPHMSVRDNLAFGLRLRGVAKQERRERVLQVAEMLNIVDQLDRQPRQLSGGQRQRVAMGRAIIREPQALLMDEPLSNLDAKLRVHMRAEIMRLHRRVGTTTLYVTHDQVEAMTMAERVAVLRQGRLEQVDTPEVLYREPVNIFVAGFMGSPAMNFVVATLETSEDGLVAAIGSQRLEMPAHTVRERPAVSRYAGREVVLGVRPEDISEVVGDSQAAGIDASVEVVERLGSEVIAHCEIDARPFRAGDLLDLFRDVDEATGRQNELSTPLIARFADTSAVRAGDRVRVSIDLQRLYLFDPTTEERII